MKKSLVLAMAMALGVTASAYAANPFSDVPAGHWAYDSISKLAAAGVIEGYGDDTFRGDRLMTRYEMAQIVAKAMAKGANVDKLAAEFADELDALGVRVAALEKKSDNVKITGYMRYHYESNKLNEVKGHTSKLRSRLQFNGKVNDTWTYVGLLQNDQDLTDNAGNEGTDWQRAYLQGRLGGVKVLAGRYHKKIVDGEVYAHRFDGIDLTYGDKVKLNAYFGRPTNAQDYGLTHKDKDGNKISDRFNKAWGVNAEADLGKIATLNVGYVNFEDAGETKNIDDKIFNAGLNFKLGKDFRFGGTYLHTNPDDQLVVKNAKKNGFFLNADYKGAKADKVGSWGVGVRYYQMPAASVFATVWDTSNPMTGLYKQGHKGWFANAHYTVAKNMVLGVEYWNMKGREDNVKNSALWTEMVVTF